MKTCIGPLCCASCVPYLLPVLIMCHPTHSCTESWCTIITFFADLKQNLWMRITWLFGMKCYMMIYLSWILSFFNNALDLLARKYNKQIFFILLSIWSMKMFGSEVAFSEQKTMTYPDPMITQEKIVFCVKTMKI